MKVTFVFVHYNSLFFQAVSFPAAELFIWLFPPQWSCKKTFTSTPSPWNLDGWVVGVACRFIYFTVCCLQFEVQRVYLKVAEWWSSEDLNVGGVGVRELQAISEPNYGDVVGMSLNLTADVHSVSFPGVNCDIAMDFWSI